MTYIIPTPLLRVIFSYIFTNIKTVKFKDSYEFELKAIAYGQQAKCFKYKNVKILNFFSNFLWIVLICLTRDFLGHGIISRHFKDNDSISWILFDLRICRAPVLVARTNVFSQSLT